MPGADDTEVTETERSERTVLGPDDVADTVTFAVSPPATY